MDEMKRKIMIVPVVNEAFDRIKILRRELFRALIFPVVIMIGLTYVEYALEASSYFASILVAIINFLVLCFFAVACHRIVLENDKTYAYDGLKKFGQREFIYAGWFILLCFAVSLLAIIPMLLFGVSAVESLSDEYTYWFFVLVIMSPAAYVFARLSLILPAIAVGKRVTFKWSWDLTQGSGMPLFALLVLVPIITGKVQSFFFRDGATFVEELVMNVIYYMVAVFEIFLLSASYRILVAERESDAYETEGK